MQGQAGPCRVKYVPVTGGQHSDLLHRRVLSPVPAEQRPHSAFFSCTARLAACIAAGALSVQPGSCRALVCTYRERPHSAFFSCTARLAACIAAGALSVQPGSCRALVCTYRERPHSAFFSCTARLAACIAAGALSIWPYLCRALVCIRRADTLYQKIRAKPTAFYREWVQSCAPKIYLTHSVRRGTLKVTIFYIFWEGLS